MNSVESFKERFRRGVIPVGEALARLGVRPNHVTLAGVVLCAGAGVAASLCVPRLALALLVLGGCCDFLDGAVARARQGTTRLGAFLDSTLDRYSEVFLYVGVAACFTRMGRLQAAMAAVLALTGSLLVSYVRARAEAEGFACREGIAQRPERLMALGLGLLLGARALAWAMWIIAAASHATAVHRIVAVARTPVSERGKRV